MTWQHSCRLFTVPTDKNPPQVLRDMLDTGERLNKNGLGVTENFVLHRFVQTPCNEFDMTKHALRHAEKLTKDQVVREVAIEYKAILGEEGQERQQRVSRRAGLLRRRRPPKGGIV